MLFDVGYADGYPLPCRLWEHRGHVLEILDKIADDEELAYHNNVEVDEGDQSAR
jgi:hypothetical protein